MIPIAWMAGASLLTWLAVYAFGGDRLNPEALYGMLGPLAGACITWVAVDRTWRSDPTRLTGVMIVGFAAKLAFFALYVAIMIRVLTLRPVPFVVAFVSYFIALYAMQALFLKRLTAPGLPERRNDVP
jgi:hypothetical protein